MNELLEYQTSPDTLAAVAIEKVFSHFSEIRSAYLYGSILTHRFTGASDVDVLFIVEDVLAHDDLFLREIRQSRAHLTRWNLDISVVFLREFRQRWHIYRPPTYFVWVRHTSRFLWGDDLLQQVDEDEITLESIYRRAVDLAQSSRSIYINDKDVSFWEAKYCSWLYELTAGVLFLQGVLEVDLRQCPRRLAALVPSIRCVERLSLDRLEMRDISEIAEALAAFVYSMIPVRQ